MVQQESSKPQDAVASRFTTPGPAYLLPPLTGEKAHDTNSVYLKNPAYSFGVRHGRFKDNTSPGPCYFPNPKMLRDGYTEGPQYTLSGRQKKFSGAWVSPGPGGCPSDKAISLLYPSEPVFSFGYRHPYSPTNKTPGSNCYRPSHITTQSSKFEAPSYSLGARAKLDKVTVEASKFPGPGKYLGIDPNIVKDRAPMFSVTGRNLMPGHSTKIPGPGTHKVNKAPIERTNPAYSFGVRHSDYLTPLIVDVPDIE